MTARLFFLGCLVLAFAQPFLSSNQRTDTGNELKIIYIDNSYSMSLKKGHRSLLDIAKEAATKQVQHSPIDSKFLLLTNDKPGSYQPLPASKILAAISSIDISPISKNDKQVMATVQSLLQTEGNKEAMVYYYSDFQKTGFSTAPESSVMKHIYFKGIPVQSEDVQNVYIDTAYLNSPVLQTGQNNQLIVHTKYAGKAPKDIPVLQLSINGQVKNAASLSFNDKQESIDTLSFYVNDASWQKMMLTINDASMKFDDSLYITARSTPNLSILVLNEGQVNPYIQAAFRTYNGFKLTQTSGSNLPRDVKGYNLIILNGYTRLLSEIGKSIAAALQDNISVLILPGKTNNVVTLNEGLRQIEDIEITGVDTAVQTASSLQQGSDLVKGLFERIPENVQLPTANWHYIIRSGLSANSQAIISFRNGDPFLSSYHPSKGSLYICATSADMSSGNFPGSYFFVPFVYQMAMQAHSSDIYALTSGNNQAAYLPLHETGERNMIHLTGNGLDMIPPQRSTSGGVNVYLDEAVQQPGYYLLTAKGTDSTLVALNADRKESITDMWNIDMLRQQWKSDNISWVNIDESGKWQGHEDNGFPLWKVCVILALIMLAVETYLLTSGLRKQTIATQ